eukprot:Trichotokara_eunicae@DN6153_c0_g2_i1.p1
MDEGKRRWKRKDPCKEEEVQAVDLSFSATKGKGKLKVDDLQGVWRHRAIAKGLGEITVNPELDVNVEECCQICTEPYDDSKRKKMQMLCCDSLICKSCLEKVKVIKMLPEISLGDRSSLRDCPFCRAPGHLVARGVSRERSS